MADDQRSSKLTGSDESGAQARAATDGGAWLKGAVGRWLKPPERSGAVAPAGLRLYAIGDVHGRADLLGALIERIREDAAGLAPDVRVRLIGLGDYVDRGAQVRETLNLLVALGWDPRIESVLLRGNHEEVLLAFLEDASEGAAWVQFGGAETLAAYGVTAPRGDDPQAWEAARTAFAERLPPAHLELLKGLRATTDAGDYFFAHAGAKPGVPLDAQDLHDLLWIREPFLRHRGAFEKVVVHGHTPAEEPFSDARRIGVDTGAYLTGVLTAVRLEGDARAWLQARALPGGLVEVVERPA